MDAKTILKEVVEKGASDIFLIPGMHYSYKLNGEVVIVDDQKLSPEEIESIIAQIYEIAKRSMQRVHDTGDDDFSFAISDLSRFRVNVFKQRGTIGAVIRIVAFELPDYSRLHIPQAVMDVAKLQKGLVLVTGPAGSGKSTTLACIIDEINKSRHAHIITLEDPIEFLHKHKNSIVTQREVATDTESYVTALRAALRQVPDVILLGELRDFETIRTAMTAAETGHLVISTLHTIGAANTIDRIVDSFPPNQQQQIKVQLSMVLQAVISQQLIPDVNGEIVPAYEIMYLNSAIRNMVRDSKIHQIDSVIFQSQEEGMIAMDTSLYKMVKEGKITEETALFYASAPDALKKRLVR
ncbi:MAG: PilT/PilU family type 4a pilus ATPase [Clostridia bacterium]|nr:PilT/PilU family type 4a pilus ATPase [Clostridia bacterium]